MSSRAWFPLMLAAGLFLALGAMADTKRPAPPGERLAPGAAPHWPEADAFAQSVMDVIEALRDDYYKPVNSGALAAWAIHGLYDHVH